MIRLVAITLVLLWPTHALAQVVAVTSGEHAGFSRLVLGVGPDATWQVGRVDGGFLVQISAADARFDTERAFDRIPRRRISDIRDLGGGQLFVASACQCHATAMDVGAGLVAIDIRDGPAGPDASEFNKWLDRPDAPVASDPTSEDAMADAGDVSSFPEPTPDAAPPAISLPLLGDTHFTTLPTAPLPDQPGDDAAAPPKASDRAQAAETALLDQIARAAAQGLVEADVPEPTVPTGSQQTPDAHTPADPPPPIAENSHVSITTSIDEAIRSSGPARTDDGRACLDDRFFDVATWGHPMVSGTDIGVFRSKLVGEFDQADGTGVTALARHYIYITFGAEAKAIMGRYPADIERIDVLMMMADIMDHARASNAAIWVEQMACPGRVSMWATAAQPQLFSYQAIDTVAVRRTFLELPPHLRRHIGPPLAAKFLETGDRATADAIENATARLFEESTPELGLLEARRALADDDPEKARVALDDVVSQADALLPDALIERVEAALAEGAAVPDDIISLLQSVGFEHRGTDTGAALARTEIRAYASSAKYATAIDRLDAARADGTAEGQVAVDLNREVFSLLVADPSDAEFLSRTIARLDDASDLPSELRERIIRRLLDLGFPAEARVALGGDGSLPSPHIRTIYAEIALAQNKPSVAIGYLAGLEDDTSTLLRARALSMAKDHAGAAAVFSALGQENAALREAWQGGDWNQVAQQAETIFGAAGNLMRDVGAEPRDPTLPPLANGAALIDESRETRAILTRLLDHIPDEPGTESGS